MTRPDTLNSTRAPQDFSNRKARMALTAGKLTGLRPATATSRQLEEQLEEWHRTNDMPSHGATMFYEKTTPDGGKTVVAQCIDTNSADCGHHEIRTGGDKPAGWADVYLHRTDDWPS